jgi:hypothetical protein
LCQMGDAKRSVMVRYTFTYLHRGGDCHCQGLAARCVKRGLS